MAPRIATVFTLEYGRVVLRGPGGLVVHVPKNEVMTLAEVCIASQKKYGLINIKLHVKHLEKREAASQPKKRPVRARRIR